MDYTIKAGSKLDLMSDGRGDYFAVVDVRVTRDANGNNYVLPMHDADKDSYTVRFVPTATPGA